MFFLQCVWNWSRAGSDGDSSTELNPQQTHSHTGRENKVLLSPGRDLICAAYRRNISSESGYSGGTPDRSAENTIAIVRKTKGTPNVAISSTVTPVAFGTPRKSRNPADAKTKPAMATIPSTPLMLLRLLNTNTPNNEREENEYSCTEQDEGLFHRTSRKGDEDETTVVFRFHRPPWYRLLNF